MEGSRIGPYKILRLAREDISGPVYEAVDLASRKPVAIRALNNDIAQRPETVARLHSEAETLALLNHPHIARTFGFIRDSGRLFLVTEFLEGETLQSLLKAKHGLEAPVALAYFHQLLSAVAFAHDLGVVHGSLNPDKVLITHFGQIKVLDFAGALLLREQEPARLHDGSGLYAAPELLRGDPADERSDLYSLGALFYQCLTGLRPFHSNEAIRAHGRGAATLLPPSLLTANCPPWLDDFILRALAPAVSDRFQTAAAMDRDMNLRVQSGIRLPAREPSSWRRVQAMTQNARAGAGLGRARRTAARQLGAVLTGVRHARRTALRLGQPDLARMNPVAASRRCLLRMNTRWTAARTVIEQARLKVLSQARDACRSRAEQPVRVNVPANTVASLRDRLIGRWNRAKLGALARAAGRGVGTSMRRWIRPRFAALSESGWQRYAAVAIVLASAMIEIFVFGGAHALLIFDDAHIPAIAQHGAAESFIEPAAEKPVSPPPLVSAARDGAAASEQPVHRAGAGRKPPARNRAEKENEYLEARVAKRVVTYRMEAKSPVLSQPRVSDPARKRSDSPPQLNVKWEN